MCLRACAFWALVSLLTILAGILLCVLIPFPIAARFWTVRQWWRAFLFLLRAVAGLGMEVKGRENIPAEAALILSKHESAWETVGLQSLFVPAVFVLKRELLWVPFLGWGLAALKMIAIDRGGGKRALQQLLAQGEARLASGIRVVVFPEGTRVLPGEKARYKPGAALLAVRTGVPVVPVAHNAADFWAKKALLIRPGAVMVSIGPPIPTAGRRESEVNAAAEAWIEAEMRVIAPHRVRGAADSQG
jgi:1-acyl-sn-glycerol-3-phosphate acyltransferase